MNLAARSMAKPKVGNRAVAATVNNQVVGGAATNKEKKLGDDKMWVSHGYQENLSFERETLEKIGGVAVEKQAVARANKENAFKANKTNVEDADKENCPLKYGPLKDGNDIMAKEQAACKRRPLQGIDGVAIRDQTLQPHSGSSDEKGPAYTCS